MFGLPMRERDAEFTRFARDSAATLKRTAYLLTSDRDLADDLVQEALLRTYLAWRRVRAGEATAYARRTLVNLNIDRWRKRPAVPAEVVERPDSRNEHARVDDHDQVLRMLASLPAQQRRVIVLRYYNDLSEADTAAALGISTGAVKSAASRGLAALRAAQSPASEGSNS
ncbi:SigE family RNA polymerase sigma factor [Micropruina sp.]|uniref:SigE family RNA polymerase sigma factor n=1 Tax=Micropruina sp. TaxID=2737536 RepID=UPI0039E38050